MSFYDRLKTQHIQPKLQELALWRINRDIMQRDYPRLSQTLQKGLDRPSRATYMAQPLMLATQTLAQSGNFAFMKQAAEAFRVLSQATWYSDPDLSKQAIDGWKDCIQKLGKMCFREAARVAMDRIEAWSLDGDPITKAAAVFIVTNPDKVCKLGLETAIYINQKADDALYKSPGLNKIRTGNLLRFAKQLEPQDPIEADYVARRIVRNKFTCLEHKRSALDFLLQPGKSLALEQKIHKLSTARALATFDDRKTRVAAQLRWLSLIDEIAAQDLDTAIKLTADNHAYESEISMMSCYALDRFNTFIDRKAETDLKGAILLAVDATDARHKNLDVFRWNGAESFTKHMATLMHQNRIEAVNLATCTLKRGTLFYGIEQAATRIIKSIALNTWRLNPRVKHQLRK